MNRRTFLRHCLPAASLIVGPAWAASTSSKELSDDEVMAQARERINAHRQGAGTITLRGPQGRPVPGAQVKLEQVRHEFLFGCNFFMFGRLGEPQLEEAYRSRFAALLNYATLGFYWPYYEPVRGQPIYDYTDQVTAWCQQQAIRCKGHPLVWDYADPRWLPQEFAEIRTLSNARVRDIVGRFQGKIDVWDVVNEPTHLGRFKTRLGEWAISMGAVPYVAEHLRLARAANAKATLLVNDYRTDPPYYRILDALRDGDKFLFDVIGIQSHMHGGGWPLRKIWEVCDDYAKLGLPIHFTETTVVSGPRIEGERWRPTDAAGESVQAQYVPKFYTALFAHPAVQGLTWWDFSDQGAWQGAAAGLVRKDMSPKPVYERLQALIKGEWWTNTTGQTNAQGQFATRAFYGSHRFSAQLPGGKTISRDVQWRRGQTAIEVS